MGFEQETPLLVGMVAYVISLVSEFVAEGPLFIVVLRLPGCFRIINPASTGMPEGMETGRARGWHCWIGLNTECDAWKMK